MKNKVYDYIINNFCFDDFYFNDICIHQPNGFLKTTSKAYEMVVFNSKKIIFFAQMNNNTNNTEATLVLREALNSIASKLSLSLHDFLVCGVNDSDLYILNTYNNKLFDFPLDCFSQFIEYVENELSYGSDIFDYSTIRELSDKLAFSTEIKATSPKEKIKVNAEGDTYINKHGKWFKASDFNTEQVFLLSVFAGMFGAHLFYLKKKSKGILYFLSFGLFGIGWLFDNIEILFGIYKDPEGKYLLPLENKIKGIITLLIGAIVFCLLGALLIFLLGLIAKNSSEIFDSLILSFAK